MKRRHTHSSAWRLDSTPLRGALAAAVCVATLLAGSEGMAAGAGIQKYVDCAPNPEVVKFGPNKTEIQWFVKNCVCTEQKGDLSKTFVVETCDQLRAVGFRPADTESFFVMEDIQNKESIKLELQCYKLEEFIDYCQQLSE